QLTKVPPLVAFKPGEMIPFRGKEYLLCHINKPRGLTEVNGDTIEVYGNIEHFHRRVLDWFKARAKSEITDFSETKAKSVGKNYSSVRIKDTRSRWGSCSANGNLSFSWRLIMAPDYVWKYVVIHEVCHLKELNHSNDFWTLVKTMDPDYDKAQAWLKLNGAGLHAFGGKPV
ncbi:MAG: M48 family metallopeptidase, partial [Proteobacteria bacterium]|nr:M48 family metallopeptidase [Pseudomonadota bacterium]